MDDLLSASRLNIDRAGLAALCRRHHVRSLRLFGSALRDDFNAQSDVDLLVEFDPRYIPGFLQLHTIAQELSACFDGRPVDLVTVRALSPRLRERILSGAEVLFAE
jgi:predicted nucleotidyltransferase